MPTEVIAIETIDSSPAKEKAETKVGKQMLALLRKDSGIAVAAVTIVAALVGFAKWLGLCVWALTYKIPVNEIPADFTIYDLVLQIGFAVVVVFSNVYAYQVVDNAYHDDKSHPVLRSIPRLLGVLTITLLILLFIALLIEGAGPRVFEAWSGLLLPLGYIAALLALMLFPLGVFAAMLENSESQTIISKCIAWLKKSPKYVPVIVVVVCIMLFSFLIGYSAASRGQIQGVVTLGDSVYREQNYAIILASSDSYCIERIGPPVEGETLVQRIDKSQYQWISKEGVVVCQVDDFLVSEKKSVAAQEKTAQPGIPNSLRHNDSVSAYACK